ncbi:CAP domain-containing protein [Syncephalis plumigaleata]|nr:CAP domain-containing protein [Syncephalis plumigaleata]
MFIKPFVTLALAAILCSDSTVAYNRMKMLCLVNKARAENGLPALGDSPVLTSSSQYHCNEQAAMDRLDHNSRNGEEFDTRIKRFAASLFNFSAENISYNRATEEEAMKGWLASPGHYANIMSKDATHMGSAVAYNSKNEPYYTQNFGGDGKKHDFPMCPGESAPSSYGSYPSDSSPASTPSTYGDYYERAPATNTTTEEPAASDYGSTVADEDSQSADTYQTYTTFDTYESTSSTNTPVTKKPIVSKISLLVGNIVPKQIIDLNDLPRTGHV